MGEIDIHGIDIESKTEMDAGQSILLVDYCEHVEQGKEF